jgi:hypothetical protein
VANDDKWALQDALPDGLDVAQAVSYREVERESPAMLGGQHHVFPDGQVWWQRTDGKWKRGVYKAGDFDGDARWVRVET